MVEYAQFCPVSKACEVLGEKWTLLVVREMLLGATRFNELQRSLPRISPTTLNKRLDELRASGLLVRKRIPGQRGHEYRLSPAGRELQPIVFQLGEWGMRWARGRMRDSELDVGHLMADIQRRIDPGKLPGGQTVLRFKFTDLDDYADWWVKIIGDDVDLCLEDPGYDVDVWFTADRRTLIEVWMGDTSLRRAQAEGRLKVVGPRALTDNLRSWFPLHVLSDIRPAG